MALTATLQKESDPEGWHKIMLKVTCPQQRAPYRATCRPLDRAVSAVRFWVCRYLIRALQPPEHLSRYLPRRIHSALLLQRLQLPQQSRLSQMPLQVPVLARV